MNAKETQLQQGISELRTRLLVMCAAVGIAVDEACASLSSGNIGRAIAVVDGDVAINALENEIDGMSLSILARQQPVAQDLRLVVAALRMVIDLERIADEAVSIAERTIILGDPLPAPVKEAVDALMDTARGEFAKTIEAFRAADSLKALELCRSDDETTQMEVKALHRIMDYFCPGEDYRHHDQGFAGMHGVLICRALNRICRRSANIAEHTYFMLQGVNIKHSEFGINANARSGFI